MKRHYLSSVCSLVLLLLITQGCKKPKQVILTKEQQKKIQEQILTEAPELKLPLNTTFGKDIELLGIDGPTKPVRVGQKITLTYYWKALKDIRTPWKVFGHLESGGKRQILDHHPMGSLYPVTKWKAGQIIVDKQTFTLDKKLTGKSAVLWVGFFDEQAWSNKKENIRLPITQKGNASADKVNRANVFSLSLITTGKGQKPAPKAPSYGVRTRKSPIVIDGKLDDAAWRTAARTRAFLRTDANRGDGSLATHGKILADDTHIYFGFHLKDKDIASPFTNRDDTLWKADVIELFLDPGADGENYVELQVNPANTVFDAVFRSHRSPKWEEAAQNTTIGLESAVWLDGTLNKSDDEDKAWSVEIKIPFADLPGVEGKPSPTDKWTANFYRIDNKGPRQMSHQRTWSPVGGDFHKLKGAGTLTFPATRPTAPKAPAKEAAPAPASEEK